VVLDWYGYCNYYYHRAGVRFRGHFHYNSQSHSKDTMNHEFRPSLLDENLCGICRYPQVIHTDKAECRICHELTTVNLAHGQLMCQKCEDKIMTTRETIPGYAEMQDKVKAHAATIEINQVLRSARDIDSTIQVRTDLFNAATKSIVEIKAAIDGDENITNKPYELAKILRERFDHYKQVVFDAHAVIQEAGNNQKAIQVYLNQMANTLRAEEREKLKIADINYQPTTPKVVKPHAVKTTGTSKKIDKTTLRKYASELGISEFVLQQVVVSKGVTVEKAADILRASIIAGKAAQTQA